MRLTEDYEANRTAPANGDRELHIPALIKQLRDDFVLLVRQEVELGKVEIQEKISRLTRNIAFLLVGGVICLLAGIELLTALTTGLVAVLESMGWEQAAKWLAPLIIGIVIGLIGYGLIQKALKTLKNESIVPEKTIESLKEDKEWIANKAR